MGRNNKRRQGFATPAEVADYLGIPRKNRPRQKPGKYKTSDNRAKTIAVVRLIEGGEVEGLKIRGEWRVPWTSVYAYEERQRNEAAKLIQERRSRRQSRQPAGVVIATVSPAESGHGMSGNVDVA